MKLELLSIKTKPRVPFRIKALGGLRDWKVNFPTQLTSREREKNFFIFSLFSGFLVLLQNIFFSRQSQKKFFVSFFDLSLKCFFAAFSVLKTIDCQAPSRLRWSFVALWSRNHSSERLCRQHLFCNFVAYIIKAVIKLGIKRNQANPVWSTKTGSQFK